jgi:hypothetical protein
LDEYKGVALWSNDRSSGIREAGPSIFPNTMAIDITHCSGSRRLLFVPIDRQQPISKTGRANAAPVDVRPPLVDYNNEPRGLERGAVHAVAQTGTPPDTNSRNSTSSVRIYRDISSFFGDERCDAGLFHLRWDLKHNMGDKDFYRQATGMVRKL